MVYSVYTFYGMAKEELEAGRKGIGNKDYYNNT